MSPKAILINGFDLIQTIIEHERVIKDKWNNHSANNRAEVTHNFPQWLNIVGKGSGILFTLRQIPMVQTCCRR